MNIELLGKKVKTAPKSDNLRGYKEYATTLETAERRSNGLRAVRRDAEFRRKLRDVLEHGDKNDFVAVLKSYKPEMSKENLRNAIMQSHVYAREKRGLY
jgi:hypothetical protein